MEITSAQYVSLENNNVSVRATMDGQEVYVPLDEENRHYQAILEWVAEGNTIQEAE